MPSIEEKVVATLMADTAITGMIGDRIYPGRAPQGCVMPYCVYYNQGQNILGDLSSSGGMPQSSMAFQCYDAQYVGAKALSKAVYASLAPYIIGEGGMIDGFDNQKESYRVILTTSIWDIN